MVLAPVELCLLRPAVYEVGTDEYYEDQRGSGLFAKLQPLVLKKRVVTRQVIKDYAVLDLEPVRDILNGMSLQTAFGAPVDPRAPHLAKVLEGQYMIGGDIWINILILSKDYSDSEWVYGCMADYVKRHK